MPHPNPSHRLEGLVNLEYYVFILIENTDTLFQKIRRNIEKIEIRKI
jgi:hypothetical protein